MRIRGEHYVCKHGRAGKWGLPYKKSPGDIGTVELIVRRPDVNTREVVEFGELNLEHGLVGDNWLSRGFRQRPDGSAHPDMQLNIMN